MIEWIIGFLVAKWWTDKEKKKQTQLYSENVECIITFGYAREGETIQDLQ